MSIQSRITGRPSAYMGELINLTITELMEMTLKRLTLEIPKSITDPIYDGKLDTAIPLGGVEKKRSLGERPVPSYEHIAVSIGKPEW